jgi:ABC-type transport system substrate-binding protein
VYTIGESWERTLERMTRGETDYVYATPARTPEEVVVELARKYGINRSQFFVKPSGGVFFLALNSSRPLFRNNPKLRQAVNFAIDRTALTAERGPYSGTPTDQYLPPSMPGYRDAHIYPLRRPDLSRARALAKGRTRAGKAVLYTAARPLGLSYARIIQDNLRRIGIEAEIKAFPPEVLFAKELLRGEPFDIAWATYAPDYLDPYSMLNLQFHGGAIGSFNSSHFDSPRYNRLLDHAANLAGAARARAYGAVDIDLARDAAPRVAVSVFNQRLFVGARVGCRILDPLTGLNLAAACLR